MTGKFSVTIDGGEELKRRLEAMGDKSLAIAKDAILEGAEIVRQEASRRAPRRTGNLAANIVVGEPKGEKPGELAVVIGPNKDAFYGLFLELGTSKMAARPFLVPALKATKKQVQETVAAALRRGLGL